MDPMKPLVLEPGRGKPRPKKKPGGAKGASVKLKVAAPTPKALHGVMDRLGIGKAGRR